MAANGAASDASADQWVEANRAAVDRRARPGTTVVRPLTWVCARADGQLLGVGDEFGLFRLVEPHARRIVRHFAIGDTVVRARWLADGRLVVARRDGRLFVRSHDGALELTTVDTAHAGLCDLAVDAAETRLATCGADGLVKVWDLPGLTPRAVLQAGTTAPQCVVFAGETVVAGYDDGFFVAWRGDADRFASGRVLRGALTCVAVDPTGHRLVFGGRDGGLQELVVGGPGEWPLGRAWNDPPRWIAVNALAFGPEGSLLAACSDDTALWFRSLDSSLGLSLGEPFWRRNPKPAWRGEFVVSAACFVPGGSNLVATSHGDGTLRLWRGVLRAATVSFERE